MNFIVGLCEQIKLPEIFNMNLEKNLGRNTDEEKIKRKFEEACPFILCSNNLTLKAEDLLEEYKTQVGVEKKFQQLKSPRFVNSLYLNTPERIEAVPYLILISMMLLSVAEYMVRREMKTEGKMKKFSLFQHCVFGDVLILLSVNSEG